MQVYDNGVAKNLSYDSVGNPLSYYNGMSFSWEMGRQLAGITTDTDTITYKYNEEGIRTAKTVNGVTTKYTLVDNKVTYQSDGTTEMYFRYDSEDNLIGFSHTKNGVTGEYYYVRNLQGDVIEILDSTGNSVVSCSARERSRCLEIANKNLRSKFGCVPAVGRIIHRGEVLSVTGSLANTIGQDNPFRYRGYYYDNESGFVC